MTGMNPWSHDDQGAGGMLVHPIPVSLSINVDLIAAGLSPFDPERVNFRAGRLVLQEIHRRTRLGESFAFETTLSGRSCASFIPRWRAAGYNVQLIFLSLPSADLAVARVSARKAQGGHGMPEDVTRRRFDKGLRNFHNIYRGLVSSWAVNDNSGSVPILLLSGDNP